jgi:predicted amidohydrolase YtcJ
LSDGWQVNVHAIGDRANGIVLDAFEAALGKADVVKLRPRLEHAQIMTKADMKRLGSLGVIASVQPTHAISDMWFAEDRLGPERVKGLYAFRSIIDAGARVTLGSDFPVESINPLSGFYAAVARVSPSGESPHGPGGWFPDQRLTRQEALRGITIDPAFASHTENILGSLEIGKKADFVILSQDIMDVPVNEILKTKVLATVIDGKPVFGEI